MAKVLVADDASDIRDLLVDTLLDAGFDVLEAKDGEEALELAVHEVPDVILLDVMMPVMDGFEVLKRLREIPSMGSVLVILLTVMPAVHGEPSGLKFGVTHYLTKPWQPGTVEMAVRIALRESGTWDGLAPGVHDDEGSQAQKNH